MGRVGQREGRLADYNPLWRVNARLVFPLPDTLFPTFSFTTASSSIYISPTSSLPSPSLSFLYSSIRLVAPVFLCGLHCRRLCRAVGMGRVSGRGKVVSRSTTRFGGSTLASSSLCPTPSSRYSLPDILLYNGLIFNIHFTNFSSPSPSLSFLYSSIRLVAPAFLCGMLCSSMFI